MLNPNPNLKGRNVAFYEKYLSGALPPEEAKQFEAHLKWDSALAADFATYLMLAKGVISEEREKDTEFGHAIKSITRDELNQIIGRKEKPSAEETETNVNQAAAMIIDMVATDKEPQPVQPMHQIPPMQQRRIELTVTRNQVPKPLKRTSPYKRKYNRKKAFAFLMGFAAMGIVVALGFIVFFLANKQTDRSETYRGEEIHMAVPEAENTYASSRNADMRIKQLKTEFTRLQNAGPDFTIAAQEIGLNLVEAYEKAGDLQNARQLLGKLIADYSDDPAFVSRCQEMLKKLDKPK